MGLNNSKGSKVQDLEFTGPIKIMHDKYGSAATHQCDRWEKLGFPKKGSFSPNQIELLKIRLQEHETKHKRNKHKWKPDWDAVVLWTKETTLRQEKQTKGGDGDKTAEKKPSLLDSVLPPASHSGGPLYLNSAQLASIHQTNLDLDCPACPLPYHPPAPR